MRRQVVDGGSCSVLKALQGKQLIVGVIDFSDESFVEESRYRVRGAFPDVGLLPKCSGDPRFCP